MVIVRLIGGLGNQLFQYAAGLGIARRNRALLKMDLSAFDSYTLHRYSLGSLNISADVASPTEVEAFRNGRRNGVARLLRSLGLRPRTAVVRESKFSFDGRIVNLRGDIYLDGYWQSEKYFADIEADVRREFAVRSAPDARSKEIADTIRSVEAVCVHVRRADYASDQTTHVIHGVCSMKYYRAAVQHIVEVVVAPHFFVFSDDPQWTTKNVDLGYPTTFVTHNGPERNYEDLRLMSLCRHFIIANSTFSWWGAWLSNHAGKVVIAPERWFNIADRDARDVVPESWCCI